jgi:hypothetical protein
MSESESSRTSLLIESPLDCLLPLLIVFTTLVYMFIHRQLHSCVGLVIVVLLHLSATKSPSSFPRFTRFTLHWSDLQSVLLFTLRWSNLLFTTMSLNHNMKLKSTSETPRLQRLLQLLPLLVIKLRKNHTPRGGGGGGPPPPPPIRTNHYHLQKPERSRFHSFGGTPKARQGLFFWR